MNFLVFDSHHYDPSIGVPADLGTDVINYRQDHLLDFLAISCDFSDCWPVVVSIIKIIPVHFINSDCENGLKLGIDSISDESFVEQLVDVDAGCMTIIEYQRMPEGLRFGVERFFMLDKRK